MSENPNTVAQTPQNIPFKAETRQLLDILIHSLYTEREVFLRELISNASDALTRMSFEMLTNHDVLDPETELGIWISADAEKNTLTIRDSGVGMTSQEMQDNLGTIAHSGARAFLEAAKQTNGETRLTDIIGQFGVGFYSAFMVADNIEVTSRSFQPDSQAVVWQCTGTDTYTIQPAEHITRGTTITIHLKSDANEFTQEYRLRRIIEKHSNYIPYPIYLGEESTPINRKQALWRQIPRQVEAEQYNEFYKQFSLDAEPPLTHLHLAVDAPVQMYALLYAPTSPERTILSLRKQDGLRLYARKVLIQDYCKDLLPEYLRFIEGVVDSEDLPLNVSRESIQSNRVMTQLRKVLTAKTLDMFKTFAQEKKEDYEKFWKNFSRYIKEGVATDAEHSGALVPLLRFHTLQHPQEWVSMDDYVQAMKPDQAKIYYLLADDERSALYSPHLELARKNEFDVLLLTDPLDSFMLLSLSEYQEKPLGNVANEDLPRPAASTENDTPTEDTLAPEAQAALTLRFQTHLKEKVAEVRATDRLVESPARLVDKEGSLNPELQRVYRLLEKDTQPVEKILEINPNHPILKQLSDLNSEDPRSELIIEQIYEDALLLEGLHPDPAQMVQRIQRLMQAALKS